MRLSSLVVFVLLLSIVFGWQLIQKGKNKTKKGSSHRFSNFIGTGVKLPRLNRIPQLSKAKSLTVPEKSPYNPCATSENFCLNGGKCLNRDGSFLCHCPPTHYGKKCELLADARKCAGHKCQNGATCISRPNAIEMIDPILEANYTKRKKNYEPLSLVDMKRLMINVSYECICRPGFVGPLCEMTDAELDCKDNFCMGRGTGILANGRCTCDCHSNYFGRRCEADNPCKNYECYNSGVCRAVINKALKRFEAVCDCPKIMLIDASITGDQCETVTISDLVAKNDKLVPCQKRWTLAQWHSHVARLLLYSHPEVSAALEAVPKGCRYNDGTSCAQQQMNALSCLNHNGRCESRVVSYPTADDGGGGFVTLLAPVCVCREAHQGQLCEWERTDECDPSPEESDMGITRESRCTDLEHGSCIVVLGDPKCLCKPGYVGEMCETYEPCAENPCWNSECIPIPSETVVNSLGQRGQSYRCLCEMGDEMNGANMCVFKATGNCTSTSLCNEGQCVTCAHSEPGEEENLLQLCDDAQQKDGFRCICKPGFHPPFCDKLEDACEGNLCENGAFCQPVDGFDYTCQCNPGTRGTLCEEVYDICLATGDTVCQNGICYADLATVRGYSCDCYEGYFGRDCQFQMTTGNQFWNFFDENYWFTWPAALVPANVLLILMLYFCCRRPEIVKKLLTEEKAASLRSSAEVNGKTEKKTNEKKSADSKTSSAEAEAKTTSVSSLPV